MRFRFAGSDASPGAPTLYAVTAVDRSGGGAELGLTSLPGAGLVVETSALAAAASGVPYDQTIAVSGQTGLVVVLDVSPTSAPGPTQNSPRWIGLLPYTRNYHGTPL